jgi:hypothetical protein
MADIDNKGTALLSLTAVLTADHDTLKARIAGWSHHECQQAIDWAVARLVNAPESEVPAHVALFLAVQEEASACHCPACRLARTAERIVALDPAHAECSETERTACAIALCVAAGEKTAAAAGVARRSYASLLLQHGGEHLLKALAAEASSTPADATRH